MFDQMYLSGYNKALNGEGSEMAVDLGSARHWARELHREAIKPGGVCVDATMGNGGDTAAFIQLSKPNGRVYAFDVQAQAIEQTKKRLDEMGLLGAQLFLCGHERMCEMILESVDVVAFNLGWLPGSVDKGITTQSDTTIKALEAACTLLKPGGLITICAYPGHEEGERELQAVFHWAQELNAARYQTMIRRYVNQSATAPVLIAVVKIR